MKESKGNMYDPAMGHSKTGSSPNDNGAQSGAGIEKPSDDALMSGMVERSRKYANPAMKEQGFDVDVGTI